MYTTCPNCKLTLLVTASDLRVGLGYVRCGRCSNVFNALINLAEARDVPADAGTPESADTDRFAATMTVPADILDSDPTLAARATDTTAIDAALAAFEEPSMEVPALTLPDMLEPSASDEALEFHPESTSVNEIFVTPPESMDIGSGTFESIILEGDVTIHAEENAPSSNEVELSEDSGGGPPVPSSTQRDIAANEDLDYQPTDEQLETIALFEQHEAAAKRFGPQDQARAANESFVEESPGDEAPAAESPRTEQAPDEYELLVDRVLGTAAEEARPPLSVDPPEPVYPDAEAIAGRFIERQTNERLRRWLLGGSVGLGCLLLGQCVHHSRDALASSSVWSGAITKLYGVFGKTLEPRWNVGAYEVRQLGAETEGSDASRLIVRASVRNAAPRAQPIPLLRLTLQDRYGNAVATRDLEPREYLPATISSAKSLAADQRVDAEIRVVDPGRSAIGFEVDACLRSAAGIVTCSNDARRRAAPATL